MDPQLQQSKSNSAHSAFSSASSASYSSPPDISMDPQLQQSKSNSDHSASSSASSASYYSSPPDISMDPQLRQSKSNSAHLASSSASSASSSASSASYYSSPPVIPMDPRLRQLLKACSEGDVSLCINLIDANPDILLSTTPHKNNCLHIAAMLGHNEFAREVWSRAPSLLSGTNDDGETPLIAALMAANLSLASDIITSASQYMQHDDLEEGRLFNCMLLKVDRCKQNVLHHSIRNDLEHLALKLLNIEPRLSEQVSNIGESPMYMAARRGHSKVVKRLLEIPSSAEFGPTNESALHIAVELGYTDIVKQLLEGRPQLAYLNDTYGYNPMHRATLDNKLEMVQILLEYDPNLAYIKGGDKDWTPFILAIQYGYVSIAKEIRSTCPDSVYITDNDGDSALIDAISCEIQDSVDYILGTPQIQRLINQPSNNGDLPLHYAARKCDPKLLRSLLTHEEQDNTAVTDSGSNAISIVHEQTDIWKTLKWIETFTLLNDVIPSGWKHAIREEVKKTIKEQAIKQVKSLTKKYISNTTLVAALLATITFAAAFTLPGGFSTDASDAGQPLFASKAAFQVFLISDTIAMCSSLTVTFICILATWEDMDFLLNYQKTTRALMWCAYVATALAFGTGLFTVIAPKNLWLAILILVLCTILPFLSKAISDWPLLMLRFRLGGLFEKDLVPNI